jgi:hypothetical protein
MRELPLYFVITAIIGMIGIVFYKVILPMDREDESKRLKKKRLK